MGKKRILGLAGLFVAGVALCGCQSSPRTNAVASSGSASGPVAAQGWDNKQTPANPSGGSGTASAGPAAGAGTAGASTSTIDPNSQPRTSQEMLPRTAGNQLSSYTTAPSRLGAVDPAPAPVPPGSGFGQGPGSTPAAPSGAIPGMNGVQPAMLNGPGGMAPPPGMAIPGAPAPAPSTLSNFEVTPPPGPTLGRNAPDGPPRDPFAQPVGAVMPLAPPPGPH
jgi:hypothetical protein